MRKTMGGTALFTIGGHFLPCVVDGFSDDGDGHDHDDLG